MSWLDKLNKQLDAAEITNPAKIYTPFTMFTIFFVMYFNAELFGAIILANEWTIQKEALSKLGNRGFLDWCWVVFKVFGSSILLTIAYGAVTALASYVWGVSSKLSVIAARKSNESGYVAQSVLDQKLKRINELEHSEKELYRRIGEYHTWKPDDIDRQLKENMELSEKLFSAQNEVTSITKEKTVLLEKLSSMELKIKEPIGALNYLKFVGAYYEGYLKAMKILHFSGSKLTKDVAQNHAIFFTIEILKLWKYFKQHGDFINGLKTQEVSIADFNEGLGGFSAFVDYWGLGESKTIGLTDSVSSNGKIAFTFNPNERLDWLLGILQDLNYVLARKRIDTSSKDYNNLQAGLFQSIQASGESLLHSTLGSAAVNALPKTTYTPSEFTI